MVRGIDYLNRVEVDHPFLCVENMQDTSEWSLLSRASIWAARTTIQGPYNEHATHTEDIADAIGVKVRTLKHAFGKPPYYNLLGLGISMVQQEILVPLNGKILRNATGGIPGNRVAWTDFVAKSGFLGLGITIGENADDEATYERLVNYQRRSFGVAVAAMYGGSDVVTEIADDSFYLAAGADQLNKLDLTRKVLANMFGELEAARV